MCLWDGAEQRHKRVALKVGAQDTAADVDVEVNKVDEVLHVEISVTHNNVNKDCITAQQQHLPASMAMRPAVLGEPISIKAW